jgi:hypothetical protein
MTPYAQYKAWWMRWASSGWDDKEKAWEEYINSLTLYELMETLELYERKEHDSNIPV